MNSRNFQLEAGGECEIVITRRFDAPPALVFEAWTRPELVRQWYGCEGSSLSVCEIDLRVGGQWRFVLRMADGSEHPFHGRYREIEPAARLVYTECYDMPALGSPQWLATVRFEGKETTILTQTLLHASTAARNGHLQAGMETGARHSFDRLASHLAPAAVGAGGSYPHGQ